MAKPAPSINLSAAKSGFSEVVRRVRETGEAVVVTVDGSPAVRIAPVETEPRPLSAAEVAIERALLDALARIPGPETPFDAVSLVREGRR
jgi:prevent-host-death family protein